MDAIDLLKQDHRNVERLFGEFMESDDPESREDLFQQIHTELLVHAEAEERVFYPAVEGDAPEAVQESQREHQEVERLLTKLMEMDFEEDEFDPKFDELVENVRRHVEKEEGPGGVMEMARQRLNRRMLARMSSEIQKIKSSMERELAA